MRFIQLWILPNEAGLPPENEQRQYTRDDRTDRLLKVVGPEGGDVVNVHQDAAMYVARLTPGRQVAHKFEEGRGGYIYLISGEATLDGQEVTTGDAAYVIDEDELVVNAGDTSELILVDVPLEYEPVGVWAR
ncbi:MAG: hypothetical protein KY462_05735 [Actinobacteria bacterium]|nr:hypothetical protein [Actinomycetota bacterium]